MPKRFGPPGWSLAATPRGMVAAIGILEHARQGLQRAAVELQSEWKQLLNQIGTGETYTHRFATINGRVVPLTGDRRPSHTASAPGEPPAKDTGQLAASIQIDDRGDRIRVGTNLRYGLALEYGVNVSGSQVGPHPDPSFVLQPRPHARPAGTRAEKEMKAQMITALR